MTSTLLVAFVPTSLLIALVKLLGLSSNPILLMILFLVLVMIALLILLYIQDRRSNNSESESQGAQGWSAFSIILIGSFIVWNVLEKTAPLSTFVPDWPDAILCRFTEPESQYPSETIFYYKGTGETRTSFGKVAIYLLVGGANDITPRSSNGDRPFGYFPHELWFRVEADDKKEHELIVPPTPDQWDKLPPDRKLGPLGERYSVFFLRDIKCGDTGNTIEEIEASHKAFAFAHPY